MKSLLVLLILFIGQLCFANELVKRQSVNQVLVPINKICDKYHSLYPQNLLCVDDKLYERKYRVNYIYNNKKYSVLIHYFPSVNLLVDADGKLIIPNQYINHE
jgi:hypothetical protein